MASDEARIVDELVREDPEGAHDLDFLGKILQRGVIGSRPSNPEAKVTKVRLQSPGAGG